MVHINLEPTLHPNLSYPDLYYHATWVCPPTPEYMKLLYVSNSGSKSERVPFYNYFLSRHCDGIDFMVINPLSFTLIVYWNKCGNEL